MLTKWVRRWKGKKGRMKNERKRGKSARNGNAPAPYTKYQKKPYRYLTVKNNSKIPKEYLEAAE